MIIFGLDGGIASVGWAVIDDSTPQVCIWAGVRGFDAPETAKERTPTAAVRRQARGQRRVVRRRRQRMAQLRTLLHLAGLLSHAGPNALALRLDPWRCRVEGLDRPLTGAEFAAALGHIARHRGFKSNSKRDRGGNQANETSRMLKAMEATQARLGQWRSIAEAFLHDPAFAGRRRNRGGGFDRSVKRDDLAAETRALFAAQARFGNAAATPDLLQSFNEAAFFQRDLQDSEALLGTCPFEPLEKRTSKRSRSFELFRLASRLAALRLATPNGVVGLTQADITAAVADFGKKKQFTYAALRSLLDLAPGLRFVDVAPAEEAKRDIAARTGAAAEGTFALRQILPSAVWRDLLARPAVLDRVAEILTFRESPKSIRDGLEQAGLDAPVVDLLMTALDDGKFARFTGAAHVSSKAARAILPGLMRGLVYSEACLEANYDHSAPQQAKLDDIRNPTVRRAVGEMVKQVRAMAQRYGAPDYIHIEMARDVGKSAEQRDEITKGIERRNKERDLASARFEELLRHSPSPDELLRFELWSEQGGRCLYTDTAIPPSALLAQDASVQVDHILPWSRFGDDSFVNKTLCVADANQRKRGRTPYEWFQQEKTAEEWAAFQARVENCAKIKSRKKRGFYLRQNAAEVEMTFRDRNLNDTRYALRLVMGLLERQFGLAGKRRIRARPGALTAKLRKAWGLEGLKKAADGTRLRDDRNHAVDACVVAATSESLLQKLTGLAQEAEQLGLKRDFAAPVPEPFPGFRRVVEQLRDDVFVSRSERRRARGQAHDATVRQVRERDGKQVVYARRSVFKLDEKTLPSIKDADRNGALVKVLKDWLGAGKPKDRLPRWPMLADAAQADLDGMVAQAYPRAWRDASDLLGGERREARRMLRRQFEAEHPDHAVKLFTAGQGPEIRSVMMRSKDKPALSVQGGTAARGGIVRMDVFREINQRGKTLFHIVPIYIHQVADKKSCPKPPCLAVVADKQESEWTDVSGFEFMFSLYPKSLVELRSSNGQTLLGYVSSLDRSTAALAVNAPERVVEKPPRMATKTLLSLRKFTVSRLGERSEVKKEKRTCHGAVCT